jgi:hypothetical protein
MKRIFLFAFLISALLGLPVTAGSAPPVLDPGCSPDVFTLLIDQASAIQARNRAYEREILNRQESTLYLTCFDQALALSSRLGYIFSDNIIPDPPPENTVAFDDSFAYHNWGAYMTLANDLNVVVSPMLDDWLDGIAVPAPALFNFLPQWLPANNAMENLAAAVGVFARAIYAFQHGADLVNVQAWIAIINQINALVNTFPTLPWVDLGPAVAEYNTLVAKLEAELKVIDADRLRVMVPLLADIKNAIFNTTMTCTRLDDLWDKLDPGFNQNPPPGTAGAFYPPEGKYYLMSPYYSLEQLVNGPPWAGAMADFTQELTNVTDAAILAQALTDLMGPLSQVGQSPVWPAPPVFPAGADAQTIINQM